MPPQSHYAMENENPINYYWRSPITYQRRAWLLGAYVFALGWATMVFIHTPRMDSVLVPVGVAVLNLLVIKWLCAKGPATLAISVLSDRIKVRGIRGEFEVRFLDIADARVRYRGLGFWDWNIVLFARNGGHFIVPAGDATDVQPQKLLSQIKARINAAQSEATKEATDA